MIIESGPLSKALWYIESHLTEPLLLPEIAQVAGVSPFYLTRAFGAATGQSVMRYVRARRLTEAAHQLANGAPDILSVAIDHGYGSHEAFTRAFRDLFGLTPEVFRDGGTSNLTLLLEPLHMNETVLPKLNPPRIEDKPLMLLAGVSCRYSQGTSARIPAQWEQFGPRQASVPGRAGSGYGVCYNSDDDGNIDYMTGVEVKDFSRLPADFATLRLPARRYAVFAHSGHISTIRAVWNAIFERGLPASGLTMADGPQIEYYPPAFDPRTGTGGFEIWIPIT